MCQRQQSSPPCLLVKLEKKKMLDSVDKLVEHLLLHYRWFFVVFFLLPISVLYEIYNFISKWLIRKLNKASRNHARRVRDVQRQVKEWKAKSDDRQMCTARPGWQTMSFRQGLYKSSMYNVRVNMYDILEINVEKKVCNQLTLFMEYVIFVFFWSYFKWAACPFYTLTWIFMRQ